MLVSGSVPTELARRSRARLYYYSSNSLGEDVSIRVRVCKRWPAGLHASVHVGAGPFPTPSQLSSTEVRGRCGRAVRFRPERRSR